MAFGKGPKIKATLAKLSGGKPTGNVSRSKYRKDKRNAAAEAHEEKVDPDLHVRYLAPQKGAKEHEKILEVGNRLPFGRRGVRPPTGGDQRRGGCHPPFRAPGNRGAPGNLVVREV